MTTNNAAEDRQDIENLLPWLATGTLNRRDALMVEKALARDAQLSQRYDLIREELAGTIEVNESLGAPSSRAMSRLMASIDAEPQAAKQSRFNFAQWMSDRITSFTPRTLAYGATAAALALVLQTGLVTSLYVGQKQAEARYEMASAQVSPENRDGMFALIGFNPAASVADVNKLLESRKLTVIDGPRANGLYKIRVASGDAAAQDAAKVISDLRGQDALIRFIVPAE